VLHPITRGARRVPASLLNALSCRSILPVRFSSLPFVLLLALAVAAPGHAQTQNRTVPQSSSSSSAQTAQQYRQSRRSYESRRLMTKQRRQAQLVTETYTHRWEVYAGGQYMRFRPGPALHNSGMGGWTLGLTRYFNPRFGITADARGYYGNNSLGPVNGGGYNVYNARFSVFPFTIGPQYRFYGSPKWSISGVVQGGAVYGYFDANTNGIPPQLVGFYSAGIVPGGIASLDIDYNVSTDLAVRIAPNVLFDHFDGNLDHNQGFMVGIVYRFGRQ